MCLPSKCYCKPYIEEDKILNGARPAPQQTTLSIILLMSMYELFYKQDKIVYVRFIQRQKRFQWFFSLEASFEMFLNQEPQ